MGWPRCVSAESTFCAAAPGSPSRFQRAALTAAAKAIGGPGLHPHELRHTAASLAIACGADVKVDQQMLGHKSATMTLDLYGHLFGDRLDPAGGPLIQRKPPLSGGFLV